MFSRDRMISFIASSVALLVSCHIHPLNEAPSYSLPLVIVSAVTLLCITFGVNINRWGICILGLAAILFTASYGVSDSLTAVVSFLSLALSAPFLG